MQHNQRRAVLISLLLGVAGTIQYHSNQFLSGFDIFFGDRGDARGFVYFCEHWYQSILGKASLLNPGIFYPTKRTLAYSDLLFGFGIPYSFFRALGFGMFSAIEIVIILGTFLSFCTAFWLLYKTLRFGAVASCAGAMFFAFSSPKFHQLTHLQLQYVVLLPLIFGLVITLAKHLETIEHKRAAVLLSLVGILLNLQLATAFYYAWYFVFWAILFFLIALVFHGSRQFILDACKKLWRALVVSAVVFLIGFIPLLLVYLPTIRVGTWYQYDFVLQMIPDWRAVLSMGDGNYLWGWFYKALLPDPRPDTWGELMVGVGLIPSLTWIALTLASVWFIKRGRKVSTPRETGLLFLGIMILATSIFYLIGFKYAGHSPWYFLYQYFPGGGAIRAVSRYVLFLTLPMSIAFAYVLQRALALASQRRVLTIVVILLAAVGVFEQFGVPKVNGTGFSTSNEGRYLKGMAGRLDEDCTAFYVAPGAEPKHSTAEYHYDAMMIAAQTRVKTLNASSSQFPPDWNMYFLKNPDYEVKVKEWIDSRRLTGKICRLELTPEVEAFDPRMASPIDEPEFFVRQLYRDFSDREPDEQVVKTQVERLGNCQSNDETCERKQVALDIFLGSGFHERGYFIVRLYEVGLGRLPRYEEFTDAMRRFSDREKMIAELAQSQEFTQTYGGLYEDDLKTRLRKVAQVNETNQQPGATREQFIQQLIESDEVLRRTRNHNLVLLHYFGYLRRNTDEASLSYWVKQLDRSGDATQITDGFIESVEYRQRFRR